MNQGMKIGAAACGIVYIMAILFLPFIGVLGVYISGVNAMSFFSWCYLPLIAGILMTVCAFVLPGKTAGIVSAICTFLPLAAFLLIRAEAGSKGSALLNVFGLDISAVGGITSSVIGTFLQVGFGVILAMISGIASAALCFMSDSRPKRVQHSPGLSSDDGDEW